MRGLQDKIAPVLVLELRVMGFKLSGVLTNERGLLVVTSGASNDGDQSLLLVINHPPPSINYKNHHKAIIRPKESS